MKKHITALLITFLLTCYVSVGSATTIGDTGWEWELVGDFDGDVYINFDPPNPDLFDPGLNLNSVHPIRIEIIKIFNSTLIDENGYGQKCFIRFTKVAPDAIPNIQICDETIVNNTGVAWTDFHMSLSWTDREEEDYSVYFNPDYTFSPDVEGNPFDNVIFESPYSNVIYEDTGDTVIPNGGTLEFGKDDSYMIIETNLPTGGSFVLKEYPSVPEPVSIGVLSLGGLMMFSRKRVRR